MAAGMSGFMTATELHALMDLLWCHSFQRRVFIYIHMNKNGNPTSAYCKLESQERQYLAMRGTSRHKDDPIHAGIALKQQTLLLWETAAPQAGCTCIGIKPCKRRCSVGLPIR